MNGPGEDTWQALHDEFARWKGSGRRPSFWLRDDDAVEPTPALDRLLALAGDFNIPIVLAVIPKPTGETLAQRLRGEPHVSVAVHGWSHTNHAPAGEKKQELGLHRPMRAVLGELALGLEKLSGLHGPRALPILVPPWNRIEANLVAGLSGIGFTALSTYGPARPAPIQVINTNIDLIDWHGTRGCHGAGFLVAGIVEQLRKSWDGGAPVGVLTHHLVHDEAAWTFLRQLFELSRDAGADWLGGGRLLTKGR